MQLAGPDVWGPPRYMAAAMAVLRKVVDSGVNHSTAQQLHLLLFQFAKARKSLCLILSKESGNVLLRVSYKWAIGYDWVSLGLTRI